MKKWAILFQYILWSIMLVNVKELKGWQLHSMLLGLSIVMTILGMNLQKYLSNRFT
jgi:hypothetical protein